MKLAVLETEAVDVEPSQAFMSEAAKFQREEACWL